MEKLEPLSKVILATGSICYMITQIQRVSDQLKMIPVDKRDEVIKNMIKEKDEFLEHTVNTLKAMMNNIGDYMNNCDLIAPIDMRATKEAFLIVVHGKDDVEK